MSELEELRRRKLRELYEAQLKMQVEEKERQEKFREEIDLLERSIKLMMTKEALTRYGTLKTAFPDRAIQALVLIGRLAEAGKLTKVDDETLKRLLAQLSKKKVTTIKHR